MGKNVIKETAIYDLYISSNNDRQPVTKTCTPLHYTCRHLLHTFFFYFLYYIIFYKMNANQG